MSETYDDLASFDAGYKPEQPFRMGLEVLPDGDYDFEITDAALGRATTGDRILKVGLKTNGKTCERTYWLKTQANMNALGADLLVLGFDSDKWGANGRPIAQELPKAVSRLPGIKFRGRKEARVKDKETYHNLHIAGRIAGEPMPTSQASGNGDIPF